MTCEHTVVEKDVACNADGMCPLCMAAEIDLLQAYAKHERSLGAEGPMRELTQAQQEIERLKHNQITAPHTAIAKASAMQAQRADALERKCNELTTALTTALTLQDALLTEISHLSRTTGGPMPIQIITAKRNFDIAMKKLLG